MIESDSRRRPPRRFTLWLVVILSVLVLCVIALLVSRDRTTIVTVDNKYRWSDTSTLSRREVVWQPAVPLAAEIKSKTNSYIRPQVTDDGKLLYFTIRTPENDFDIYQALRSTDGWSEPEKTPNLNSEADDVGPIIREDGNVLYLYSNRDGGFGGMDLYISVRKNDGWTKPVNMGANVNSAAHEYDPAIAPNGQRLYFSSNRSDPAVDSKSDRWSTTLRSDLGNRTFDLYVASLDQSSNQWSPATSLDRLNTHHNEGAPFVSPDGAFLYFASDRPTPRGEAKNFDIYRVAIDRPMMPLENLGASVNTSADEIEPALAADGFRLQFSRSDGSKSAHYSLYESTAKEIYFESRWENAYGGLADVGKRMFERIWLILVVLAALAAIIWMIRQVTAGDVAIPGFLILALLLHLMLVSGSFFVFFENRFTAKLKDMFLEQTVVASEVLLNSNVPKTQEPSFESVAAIQTPAPFQPADVSRQIVEARKELTPIEFAKPQRIAINTLSPTRLPTEPVVATVPMQHEAVAVLDPIPRAAMRVELSVDAVPLERTVAAEMQETENVEQPFVDFEGRESAVELHVEPIEIDVVPSKPVLSSLDWNEFAPAITPPVPLTRVTVELERAGSPTNTDTQHVDTPIPTEKIASVASEVMATPKTRNITFERESIMAPAIQQPEPLKLALRSSGALKPERSEELVPLVAEHDSEGSLESEPASSPLKRRKSSNPKVASDALVAIESIARIAEESDALESSQPAKIDIDRKATKPAPIDVRALVMKAEPASVPMQPAESIEPIPLLMMSAGPDRPVPLSGGPLSRRENRSRTYAAARVKIQNLLLRRKLDEPTKAAVVTEFGGNDATLSAIRRGLSWIEQHQAQDGRWSLHQFDKQCDGHKRCNGHGNSKSDTAGTGLALLPFLGDGNTHQEGLYKDAVARGVTWLISNQKKDGNLFTGGAGNAVMYSHGIATIALCECYGMTKDPRLREPCQRAIDFIVTAQDPKSGGWRYRPREYGDTSVVGWQVMALKSAQMAELAVPEKTFAESQRWLESVAGQKGRLGQFAYQRNKKFNPAMTAEAMLCLEYMDHKRDSESLLHAADFLVKNLPKKGRETSYYWYYATQAMFHLQGDHWKQWNEAIHPLLIDTQLTEGSLAGTWDPRDQWEKGGGRIYSTSIRVLMLEVYYRHLPIYHVIE